LSDGYFALSKSYFQEKGKNLATKEDIEGLTLKVESVKQQFIEKNANLKAKLDFMTNLQISHKNDERFALIDFHKKLKRWIGLLTESKPSLMNNYDNSEIQTKLHQYSQIHDEVLSSQAVIELYIEDKSLYELIYKLKKSVIENLGENPLKFLVKLKQNNLEIEGNNSRIAFGSLDKNKQDQIQKRILDERDAIFTEYKNKLNEGLKKCRPLEIEYLMYLKDYLKKMPED
jgi:hypothetical protein